MLALLFPFAGFMPQVHAAANDPAPLFEQNLDVTFYSSIQETLPYYFWADYTQYDTDEQKLDLTATTDDNNGAAQAILGVLTFHSVTSDKPRTIFWSDGGLGSDRKAHKGRTLQHMLLVE